jgi:hypothetical protein
MTTALSSARRMDRRQRQVPWPGLPSGGEHPMASKLVNKINYASSMQSHLTGANNLYNDLHTAIVGKNTCRRPARSEGVEIHRAFMYFTKRRTTAPEYKRPCTFGVARWTSRRGLCEKAPSELPMIEGSTTTMTSPTSVCRSHGTRKGARRTSSTRAATIGFLL